jgi:hypothetical protein
MWARGGKGPAKSVTDVRNVPSSIISTLIKAPQDRLLARKQKFSSKNKGALILPKSTLEGVEILRESYGNFPGSEPQILWDPMGIR